MNSLTLTYYQHTDLGYLSVGDFRYRLIRESLIFATFLAAGMGTRDGLYVSIYGSVKYVTLDCEKASVVHFSHFSAVHIYDGHTKCTTFILVRENLPSVIIATRFALIDMHISVAHSWTNIELCLTCWFIWTACELVQKMSHERHVLFFYEYFSYFLFEIDGLQRQTISRCAIPEKCIYGKCCLWPWPLNLWPWKCPLCHVGYKFDDITTSGF